LIRQCDRIRCQRNDKRTIQQGKQIDMQQVGWMYGLTAYVLLQDDDDPVSVAEMPGDRSCWREKEREIGETNGKMIPNNHVP